MGLHKAPHKPPTLADVARLAGVSRSVAGSVLNGGTGNTRFSARVAELVRDAAGELQYRPNHAARLLRGKRSRTFGVLVASAGDPLRSFLVQYLDAAAVRIGCRTLVANTIGNPVVGPDQFDYHVGEFTRRGVDGVLCAVHHWVPGDRRKLLLRHPNTVFYESPAIPDARYVTVDRHEAARLAVRHLAQRGRKRIGLAVMALSRASSAARREGYVSALTECGLPIEEGLVFDGESHGLVHARCNEETGLWEFPHEVMDYVVDALVRDGRADAIVAHDDFWAAALIRRMRARGIQVPRDVAVVGYLNHYLADWTDPPLTTVDLAHREAATRMIAMLEDMVQGTVSATEHVVKVRPKLIVREST